MAHPCRDSGAETIRKSRRVKGGQLPQGRAARLAWLGRSALPPILTSGSILRRPFGLGDRPLAPRDDDRPRLVRGFSSFLEESDALLSWDPERPDLPLSLPDTARTG